MSGGVAGVRPYTVALTVAVAPIVLVGIALTLSIFGAPFGIPALVVSLPLVFALVPVLRGDDRELDKLATRAFVYTAVLAVALVVAALLGWDDLDTAADVGVGALGAAWVAASLFGATGAARAARGRDRREAS